MFFDVQVEELLDPGVSKIFHGLFIKKNHKSLEGEEKDSDASRLSYYKHLKCIFKVSSALHQELQKRHPKQTRKTLPSSQAPLQVKCCSLSVIDQVFK